MAVPWTSSTPPTARFIAPRTPAVTASVPRATRGWNAFNPFSFAPRFICMSPTRPRTMNTLRITLPLLFAGLVVAAGSAASGQSSRQRVAPEPTVVNDAPCEQAVRGDGPGRPLPIPMSARRMAPITEADAMSPVAASPAMAKAQRSMLAPSQPADRDNYKHREANAVHLAANDPVSTFSIDVDTGSYTNVRHMLNEGRL